MKLCPICETTYSQHQTHCERDGAVLVASRDFEPGTLIRNKYRIERVLGRGGMGTVYLAEHLLLGRQRALKFISTELSHDAKLLKRFRQEAQAASELRHPNIAEVVDLDQAEDGTPYIAMEYVEGPSLRQAMEPHGMAVERAIAIARGVALGLEAAHGKSIVHRDVKPENILLAQKGDVETAKLLDFGIAAILEGTTGMSRTRGLMLTPEYAAPEQWKGLPSEEMDGRVDLYALGGVLHEMLTGRTCFVARNTQEWLYQHLQDEPKAPSELRPELLEWSGLDALVLKLLAKKTEDRPASAAEVVRQLESLRRVPRVTRPVSASKTVVERPRRTSTLADESIKQAEAVVEPQKKSPALLLGSVAVLLLGMGGFFGYRMLHSNGQQAAGQTAQNSPNAGATQLPTTDHSSADTKQKPANAPVTSLPGNGPAQPTTVQPGTQNHGNNQPESQVQPRATPSGGQPAATVPQQPQVSGSTADAKRQAKVYADQKNFAAALPLYEKACNAGDQESCVTTGFMYVMGNGTNENDAKGMGLMKDSCDKGYAPGCTDLGHILELNISTLAQALNYFTRGCDGGDPFGCNSLAFSYAVGHGVSKDTERAKQLYGKSCSLGNQGGCNELKKLQDKDAPPKPTAVESWTDPATGLTWTKTDNGQPTDYSSAVQYCRTLNAGGLHWRLPTLSELRTIYDPQASVPCVGLKCRINPVFTPTSPSFWASDPGTSGNATLFGFNGGPGGGQVFDIISSFDNARAMCVKR